MIHCGVMKNEIIWSLDLVASSLANFYSRLKQQYHNNE